MAPYDYDPSMDPNGNQWVESGPQPQGEPPAEEQSTKVLKGYYPVGNQWMPYFRDSRNGQYYIGGDGNWQLTGDMPPGNFVDGTTRPQQPPDVFFNDTPPPAADPGGGGGGGGGGLHESHFEPWREPFRAPSGSQLPTWRPPQDFSYADYEPPTADDVLKDPGYLFRRDQVTDSIENSAASRGLLGSSGTLYDVGQASSDFASQEYGKVFDRSYDVWGANRRNAFDSWNANYGVDRDTYGYQVDRAEDVYNRAWSEYTRRRDDFYTNQRNRYDRLTGTVGGASGAA